MSSDDIRVERFQAKVPIGLSIAMSTGGLARAAVPLISSFLLTDLGISASQFGLSVTVMVAMVAVGVPIFGAVADRFGARRVLILRGAGAAIALVGVALAQHFGQLLASQAVLGFVIAGGVPASNRVIAEAVPAAYRGLAVGIKQSGATIGVLIAGIAIPTVAVTWGWRWSIVVVAMLSVLTVPAVFALVPRTTVRSAQAEQDTASWRDILANPSARWLCGHGFLSGIGIAMVFAFVPLYATEAVGLSPTTAGQILGLMSVMAIGARISWGRISDLSGDLGRNFRTISSIAVVAVVLIAMATTVGAWSLWLGAAVAGLSMEAWNSLAGSGIISSVPISRAGRASSVVQVTFMAGNAIGPTIFGATVDASGGFAVGWTVCGALFVVAAIMRYRPHAYGRSPNVEGTEVIKRIEDR